jgi:hypothetical protein
MSFVVKVLQPDLPLPDILLPSGLIKLLPMAFYEKIPAENLQLWCHKFARYGIPTVELIEWLQEWIGGKTAIEIGAGAGDLAHYLNIIATDNRMQEWPEIYNTYRFLNQPVIKYPKFIQKFDAVEAVKHFKPNVVIACWVTEWIDPTLPPPPAGGNIYGVKEDEILREGCTYILIGNEKIHGAKKIMSLPHKEFTFPFLVSRSIFPKLNRIWVWNGKTIKN